MQTIRLIGEIQAAAIPALPVVRRSREEEILFVWTGLTLVLPGILYEVWSA
jgi:hypothetical protein